MIHLTITILFLLLSFHGPVSLYSAGLRNASVNSGGTVRAMRGVSAISIGNIDQRRLFVPPRPQAFKTEKKKSPAQSQGPDPTYKLGEVYAFPNPAKHGKMPTVHVEVGVAESVEFRFYDISGNLVHKAEITGSPQVIDDGQGPQYAYEYTWSGSIPSGTYLCAIHARKNGSGDLKRIAKLAVVR